MKTKDYCTQNDGDCRICSLVNYGLDCRNNALAKNDNVTPNWTCSMQDDYDQRCNVKQKCTELCMLCSQYPD